jgi:hypothetical protein
MIDKDAQGAAERFMTKLVNKDFTLSCPKNCEAACIEIISLNDLKPDVIDYSYIEKIKDFSNIKDVSDTIHFNDGMDD